MFALCRIFSNNVMLGIPVATVLLGHEALPSVALVLVFNSLILWTLLTLSVEWAKQGSFSLKGIGRTLLSVAKNPLIIGILSGTAWSFLKQPLPLIAAPLSLVTLGMSLAHYRRARRTARKLYHLSAEADFTADDCLGDRQAGAFAAALK